MEATEEEKSLIIFKQEFHSVVNEVDTKKPTESGYIIIPHHLLCA